LFVQVLAERLFDNYIRVIPPFGTTGPAGRTEPPTTL